jgi:hypothetical protein
MIAKPGQPAILLPLLANACEVDFSVEVRPRTPGGLPAGNFGKVVRVGQTKAVALFS